MTKLCVISGGQTGVDQAALRAAKAAGLETGGWAPKGWTTEAGRAPWLADYGLLECPAPGYPARTLRNVADATACLWLGNPDSPGGKLTLRECRRSNVLALVVVDGQTTPADVVRWLRECVFRGDDDSVTLMVAGNRESSNPGIGERAERFLVDVFWLLSEGLP